MAQLPGWILCKKIMIKDIHVDSDLAYFPVYIPIKNDADLHRARADGYDIRFTLSDGITLLKYEREYWTGGNGNPATAHFWVKVPSILATGGAIIYCYYGKSDAPDGQDAPNVWDANFKGVWHMKDLTPSTVADSIGVNDGIKIAPNEPLEVDGKIYKGQYFDGENDFVNIEKMLFSYPMTVSILVEPVDTQTRHYIYASKGGYDGFGGEPETHICQNGSRFHVYCATEGVLHLNRAVYVQDTEKHLLEIVLDSTYRLYVDGILRDSLPIVGTPDFSGYDAYTRIGKAVAGLGRRYMKGLIDEVRISNIIRIPAWIKFKHHNINEADNEMTWGKEEGVYYGPGFPIFEKKKELLLINERKPVLIGHRR